MRGNCWSVFLENLSSIKHSEKSMLEVIFGRLHFATSNFADANRYVSTWHDIRCGDGAKILGAWHARADDGFRVLCQMGC